MGAYECGVYKTLIRHKIKLDIVAGTSIGAINAAIIVGTKNNNPARDLQEFWLTVADESIPSFLPDNTRPILSVMRGSLYGNKSVFEPKWVLPQHAGYYYFNSPHIYDLIPLKETLNKFIDFSKINDRLHQIDKDRGSNGTSVSLYK